MILSTVALAGRYSEGGGREEDIPYWSFIWVALMSGVGLLQRRLPLNLKLNCCFALLTSNRKSLRCVWNIRVELIWSTLIFFFSLMNCLKGVHQLSTSKWDCSETLYDILLIFYKPNLAEFSVVRLEKSHKSSPPSDQAWANLPARACQSWPYLTRHRQTVWLIFNFFTQTAKPWPA